MAKASRKRAASLAARIQIWEDMKSEGGSGNTKDVRCGQKLLTFHKPGSEKK